jgi:uncharacterized protein YndB with AHSA1/START domain
MTRTTDEVFRSEVTIDRPAAAVWDALVDWESAPRWMPGVESLRAEGPTAPGTRVVFTSRGTERSGELADVEPGRSVTVRSVQGGVTADYTYTCVPLGTATRVTLRATCRITGPTRLLGPVIRAAIRRADSRQLDAFARELFGVADRPA